jgi:hypothetical protein
MSRWAYGLRTRLTKRPGLHARGCSGASSSHCLSARSWLKPQRPVATGSPGDRRQGRTVFDMTVVGKDLICDRCSAWINVPSAFQRTVVEFQPAW